MNSKFPPRKPCFAIFSGSRHVRNAMYEHITEPVEVVKVSHKGELELGVRMIGRQHTFRMETFSGEWTPIELGEVAQ